MNDTNHSGLDEFVKEQMEKWGVPGIALAILKNGEVDARAYGSANLETGYEMTTDTLLQIGSISKIFCTTLAMKLVDDGVLDLESPVSRYLPSLRLTKSATQDQVKVKNLFTHTSGVYGDHFADFGFGDSSLEDYVASMADLDQVYEPGTIWSYTNSGFNLAGRIAEIALDMTFEDAVKKYIFDPLGMESTFYLPWEVMSRRFSVGHTTVKPGENEHEVARRWPIPRASGPAGSISSNVSDMLKFARFHLNVEPEGSKSIISDFSRQLMQDVHVRHAGLADSWGLGWHINFFGDTKVIGHGGATNGFNAHLDLVPSQNWAMVTLTNSGQGSAAYRKITRWALENDCGLTRPELESSKLEQDQLAEYVGTYERPNVKLTVGAADGQLTLDIESKSALADDDEESHTPPTIYLESAEKDLFVVQNGTAAGSTVGFLRYPDGDLRFIRFGGRVVAKTS